MSEEKPYLPNRPRWKVVATVKHVPGLNGEDTHGKGPCQYYRPGDKIIFDKTEIKGKICYPAIAALLPHVELLRSGLDKPPTPAHVPTPKGKKLLCCLDWARPVIFEFKRIKGSEKEPFPWPYPYK